MNNKNIKKNHRAHLDDFSIDVSGQYIYNGDIYRLCDSCKYNISSLRLKLIVSGVIALGLLLFAGCLPVEAMLQVPYVVLPYMVSIIVAVRIIWAIVRFAIGIYPLREYVYSATICKLNDILSILITFIVITLIGFTFYTVLHGFGKSISLSLLFVISEALSIYIALYQKKIISITSWEKVI